MRNLTITRRKSFVACAMKDQVYIRDEQSPELTIDGVPCRKVGEIKNGETKTFPIGEEEQQIFLIVDTLSKDYCNGTVTVPAGQEDVSVSGVHKFSFGSNPFRFDGVELSEQQLAKQKKNNRKGTFIMIGAIILGLVIGFFATNSLFGLRTVSPKTFTKGEFQITLTDDFAPTEEEGYYAFYQSKSALVFALREGKEHFDDITLAQYADLVLEANGRTDLARNQGDGFIWFEYTDTPDDQEVYYISVCCQGEDAFWIVSFATPEVNRNQYKETFLNWAKTIKVG